MATYYVDYKNGVDTNDGSSGSPLKTLAHAIASHAGNDDTLLLRGTSATDEIHRVSGVTASETGFTIAADTGHYPVASGSVAYSDWALTAGQASTYETAYTTASCYMVWNGTTFLTSRASIVLVEANENSFFFDDAGNMLYVHIAGGGEPGTLEVHAGNTVLTMSGTGATVRGIIFEHGLFNLTMSGTNATVDQCTLQWPYHPSTNSSTGLSIDSTGAIVKNCRFYDYYGRGIDTGTGAGTLTVQDSGFVCSYPVTASGNLYGINLDVGTGHIVERCTMQGYVDGVYVQSACSGTIVRHCTFINIQHSDVIWDNCDGAIGYNNISYYTTDWADTAASHHGFVLHNYGATYIYHNVFAWMNRRTEGDECGLHVSPKSGVQTLHAKNNIFYNCGMGIQYSAGAGAVTYDLGCNAFFGNTDDFVLVDPGDQGTGNVTTDPLFVNPLNYDFRLGHNSPCIDTGAALTGYNEGFRGGAPDIGAIEYVKPLPYHRYRTFFVPNEYTQEAAGSWSSAGALAWIHGFYRTLAGAWEGAGALKAKALKSLAAIWAGEGVLDSGAYSIMYGAWSGVGTLAKKTAKSLAGAWSGVGGPDATTVFSRAMTGAWEGAGEQVRKIGKGAAGAWSGIGALTTGKLLYRTLAGAWSGVGALTRKAALILAGAWSGIGAQTRKARKPLAGAWSGVGAQTRKSGKILAGAWSGLGELITLTAGEYAQAVAGAWSGVGTQTRKTATTLAGAWSGAGAIVRLTAKGAAGAWSGSGSLAELRAKILGGAWSGAGAVTRATSKGLAGAWSGAGSIARRIAKGIGGAWSGIGSLARVWQSLVTALVDLTLHARSTSVTLQDRETTLSVHDR